MQRHGPFRTALPTLAALLLLACGCLPDLARPEEAPGQIHHDWDGDGYCEDAICPDGVGGGDCDDEDATIHPGADEACDGVDNDCDGSPGPDEVDADGDGFMACGDEADCDDTDGEIHVGAAERCNGEDDDCDGLVPDDESDGDGDGQRICEEDCDDGDPTVGDGFEEVCDGIDNDCDGATEVDEGTSCYDDDGDGFTEEEGDCDDGDLEIGPEAAEVCDSADNDCDGVVDGVDCVACNVWVPTYHDTIQEGIDAAGSGDVVCVEPGTHLGQVYFGGLDIHLLGVAGPSLTIVDAEEAGIAVRIVDAEGADTVMQGFTVTGGQASQHCGGMNVSGSSPTLLDLRITGNETGTSSGTFGGGMCLSNSSAWIERVEISDNVSHGSAGGISADSSDAVLIDVVVTGNEASNQAGGLRLTESPMTLTRVTVSDNTANSGAGLEITDCNPALVDVWITDNEANTSGGGLYLHGANPTIEGGVIAGNQAGTDGGGLQLVDWSRPALSHVRIAGNQADGDGGGVRMGNGCQMDLSHGMLLGNVAGGYGGGIRATGAASWPSQPTLTHVAVVGNQAEKGAGLAVEDAAQATLVDVDISGNLATNSGGGILLANDAVVAASYSNVYGNSPDQFSGMDPIAGEDGNLSADPGYQDLSDADPLVWDLHLSVSSPLVDAGEPSLFDPDSQAGDIGAYGGPDADGWDLDRDGFPEWWQPGPYDPATHPFQGLDCDDQDASVFPGEGC